MTINPSAYHASSTGLNRLPSLGGKLLRFNLTQEVAQLQSKDAWRRNSGRSSKTLVKYPDLHIVLILMKAGTQLGKHHVDGRISIQLLQGAIRAQLPEQSVPINPGDLLTLEYGIPHNIEAIKESAFLITISWPGGTKDERHARYI